MGGGRGVFSQSLGGIVLRAAKPGTKFRGTKLVPLIFLVLKFVPLIFLVLKLVPGNFSGTKFSTRKFSGTNLVPGNFSGNKPHII